MVFPTELSKSMYLGLTYVVENRKTATFFATYVCYVLHTKAKFIMKKTKQTQLQAAEMLASINTKFNMKLFLKLLLHSFNDELCDNHKVDNN